MHRSEDEEEEEEEEEEDLLEMQARQARAVVPYTGRDEDPGPEGNGGEPYDRSGCKARAGHPLRLSTARTRKAGARADTAPAPATRATPAAKESTAAAASTRARAKAGKDTELAACIATCMRIDMTVPVDVKRTKADNGHRSTARAAAGRFGITRAMPK